MNPFARLFTAILAVLVLTGAFFFGLAVLAVLLVAFSVFALIFFLRSWWLARSNGDTVSTRSRTVSDDSVIDAEYTVVSRRRK